MSSTPFFESGELWRFQSGSQEVYCLLQPHPIGHELRYVYNGVQLICVASPNAEELRQRAEQWRLRLIAEGWSEAPTGGPPPVRSRTAATRH